MKFRLGRTVAQFAVGAKKELFTIHEDLVCVSPFFRDIFQPRRKAIEGDCSICHELLNTSTKELTYCSTSCGGNFHRACMDEWTTRQPRSASVVPKCPLCRQEWNSGVETSRQPYHLPHVSSSAFSLFAEWSYRTCVPFDENADEAMHQLIEAHIFGTKIGNKDFCEDVLRALLTSCIEHRLYPGVKQIKRAYDNTAGFCRLRKFLVDLHTHLPKKSFGYVFKNWDGYPKVFLHALILTLLSKLGEKSVPWTLDALQAVLFPGDESSNSNNEGECGGDDTQYGSANSSDTKE